MPVVAPFFQSPHCRSKASLRAKACVTLVPAEPPPKPNLAPLPPTPADGPSKIRPPPLISTSFPTVMANDTPDPPALLLRPKTIRDQGNRLIKLSITHKLGHSKSQLDIGEAG